MGVTHNFEGIRYKEFDNVYPVSEDTLFLFSSLKEILKNEKGKILDMGCGVGLISLVASSYGWDVVSVDREPLAMDNLRSNLAMNGSTSELYISDLFEGIPMRFKGNFDIISFNPPYLPSENIPMDRRADLALVGGEKGYEIAENFLRSSVDYLKEGGKVIILAYSSWKIIFDRRDIGLKISKTNFEEKDIDGEKFIVMEFSKMYPRYVSRTIISQSDQFNRKGLG